MPRLHSSLSFGLLAMPISRGILTLMLGLLFCLTLPSAAKAQIVNRVEDNSGQARPIFLRSATHKAARLGPDSALVKITLFLDLSQGSSIQTYRTMLSLHNRHPQRLQIEVILTDPSVKTKPLVNRVAMEAKEQGVLLPFLLILSTKASSITDKTIQKITQEIGMNPSRTDKSYLQRHNKELQANTQLLLRTGASRTPAMLINGQIEGGFSSLDRLEKIYDTERDRALLAIERGATPKELEKMWQIRREQSAQKPIQIRGRVRVDLARQESIVGPRAIDMDAIQHGGHRLGPKSPKTLMVLFCHLQSNLCKNQYAYIKRVQESYSEELAVVFQFLYDPLEPSQNGNPLRHKAALCAEEQGALWEFVQVAFDAQNRILDEKLLFELVGSSELPIQLDTFSKCINSPKYDQQIVQGLEHLRSQGLVHTPSLAIDGLLYPGQLFERSLIQLVRQALSPGWLRRSLLWPGLQ